MHNAIALSLAALMAVAIIVIGSFYLASPQRMTGSFGLKPPASDVDTRAWLRLKGTPPLDGEPISSQIDIKPAIQIAILENFFKDILLGILVGLMAPHGHA